MLNAKRIDTIDFLRGIAVIIMIFANSSPYLFDLKSFFTIRFLFSIAAPIFIFIAGFTSQMNFERGSPISYYRILQILTMAVVIDIVIWRSVPFYTFDVLYLIGISKLILKFLNKVNKPKYILLFLCLIIGLSIFITMNFSYRYEISDILLNDFFYNYKIHDHSNPLMRLLYDGWFPLLPWTIIAIIGSLSYKLLGKILMKYSIYLIVTGVLLLAILHFKLYTIQFPVREKYLEIFYPLTSSILIIPVAVFFIVLGIIKWKPSLNIGFINLLGRYSLFAYVINALIDSILERNDFQNSTTILKLILLFLSFFILIVLVQFIDKLKFKPAWQKIPKGVKFIMGF